jgi:hypothetical protein
VPYATQKANKKNMFFFVRLTEQQQQYFINLLEIKILP